MKKLTMLSHLVVVGMIAAQTAAAQSPVQVIDDSSPGQPLSIDKLGQSA